MTGRVFPAGTGGNPTTAQLGKASDLAGTTAQPAIRQNPEVVQKTVEPFTDDGVPGYADGAGNRIWHPDTSASARAIIFTSAAESTDFSYVVKWVKGSNPLTIAAAAGLVNGTTTFAGVTVGDAYEFRSDGTDYQLVSRVGDFVTSGGPASFSSLTVAGSSTFSGTVAFLTAATISGSLSVGTLVVSGTASFSGTVVMNSLTVAGTASFSATVVMNSLTVLGSATFSSDVYVHGSLAVSATLSVGLAGITVGGVPLSSDVVKLSATAISNNPIPAISGSWSDYTTIEVHCYFTAPSAFTSINAYASADNGATRVIDGGVVSLSARAGTRFVGVTVRLVGNGATAGGLKILGGTAFAHDSAADVGQLQISSTANSAFINEIGIYALATGTKTLSTGYMYAYGYK